MNKKTILEKMFAGIIIIGAISCFFVFTALYVLKDLLITLLLLLMAIIRGPFALYHWVEKIIKKSR